MNKKVSVFLLAHFSCVAFEYHENKLITTLLGPYHLAVNNTKCDNITGDGWRSDPRNVSHTVSVRLLINVKSNNRIVSVLRNKRTGTLQQ